MTYPVFEVSFAFGIPASTKPAAGDWVDVSAYVSELTTMIGSRGDRGYASAGSAQLELDNSTGRFDPDNTAGPYYGNLRPLTWCRIRGGPAVTTDDVFYGHVSIEGWRLSATPFVDSVVAVEAVDLIEYLANTQLPESVYAQTMVQLGPIGWYRLGEALGTVATDSSAYARHGTYEGGATFGSRLGLIANSGDSAIYFDGVDDLVRLPASAGIPSGDATWTVEAWINLPAVGADDLVIWEQKTQNGYSAAVAVSGTSGSPGTVFFQQVTGPGTGSVIASSGRYDDSRTHHVVAVNTATLAELWVDGVRVATGTPFLSMNAPESATIGWGDGSGGGALIIGDGYFTGIIDEVAIYSYAFTATDVADHYSAGKAPRSGESTNDRVSYLIGRAHAPTGSVLSNGSSTVGPLSMNTDALSAIRDVVRAERGEFYVNHHDTGRLRFNGRSWRWTDAASTTSQVTFGDGGGTEIEPESIDIDDAAIINRAIVQRFGGSTFQVNDAASETTYLRRSVTETGLPLETDDQVVTFGRAVVAENKDARRWVRSVTVMPTSSTDAAWDHVFVRRIGDRATVRWRPPYGGTYSFPSYIEGISHRYSARVGELRTTFYLSPVPYGATGSPYWVLGTSTLGTDTRAGY